MDYTGMDGDRMFGAGDGVTLLDQIKADRVEKAQNGWPHRQGWVEETLAAFRSAIEVK